MFMLVCVLFLDGGKIFYGPFPRCEALDLTERVNTESRTLTATAIPYVI